LQKEFCDAKLFKCFLIVCLLFLSMLVLGFPIVGGEGNNGNPDYCDLWNFDNLIDLLDFTLTHNGSVEVVVGIKDGADYDELVSSIEESGGTVVDTIFIQDNPIAIVADVPLNSIASFVDELKATGLPMYVEPNMKSTVSWVPNDPGWSSQWGPRRIEADYAWNITTGDPSVIVAVIDTGVEWDHPDLAANIWTNPDEVLDGIDNDGNGFIDDIRGWDFVDTGIPVCPGEDGIVEDNDPMDFHGHGTHCSGIVAAVTNNSVGIAGVAGRCKIMALRAGFKDWMNYGRLEHDDIAQAIIYAVDNGADIISMSFGGVSSIIEYAAIKYAYDAGVLLVASAGNDASDYKSYPAAYDEVVAVTATAPSDIPALFTNYGDWVEVAAPGVSINSTYLNGNYIKLSGTSMAAPHVSGVAALIWSQFPNMTRDQVRSQLCHTADDLGSPGFDEYYGYGRINARKAVGQGFERDLVLTGWTKPCGEVGLTGIKATVFNYGANSESNIQVDLLINCSLWDTRYISFLPPGETATVTWLWFREPGKLYNLSVCVIPKPGEIDTENNNDWSWLWPEGGIIKVPENYLTIQEAVNEACPSNTILVASGMYNETVYIYKSGISLIGENRSSTVIDGYNEREVGIHIVADQVHVSKFTIRNFTYSGIYLVGSSNGTITDNNLVHNYVGIFLAGSGGNTITRNKIAYNNDAALFVYFGSNGNTISENLVKSNNKFGIALVFSDNNNVNDNLVTQTHQYSGIILAQSDGNSMIHNILLSNYGTGHPDNWIYRFSVCVGRSRGNLIKHNHLKNNAYGIATVYYSRDNRIYHNNFLHNTIKLFVHFPVDDIWHNRWACEGNYWSDYEGEDQDGDGVGDTNLPHLGVDSHPLMSPWYPGDVNHDGIADIIDIVIISVAYGSHPGDPKWNPHADVNEDGLIDISDINIVSAEFGETWTTYWEKPLEVLAEDQQGNPLTMEVWIDEEFVGYTGTSFDVLRGPHEIWVKETYTFSHWEDTSTENPRILIIDSAKTVTAYFDK
jgi:parallel beta-helix repeat protein